MDISLRLADQEVEPAGGSGGVSVPGRSRQEDERQIHQAGGQAGQAQTSPVAVGQRSLGTLRLSPFLSFSLTHSLLLSHTLSIHAST